MPTSTAAHRHLSRLTRLTRPLLGAIALLGTSFVHAQSNVTVYGILDEYLEVANGGNGSVKRLSSGGVAGSRLGFRGSEDLGSGLRAVFVMEHDFLGDTGAPATAIFWNRQTYVGLSSSDYGSLTAGRQYTPYFSAMASTDPSSFGMGSALNYFAFPGFAVSPGKPAAGINGTLGDSTTRRSNSVLYTSPSLSGVQLKLFGSASEGTDARVMNGSIGYTSPTLFAAASYLSERTTYITNNTDKYTLLVAGYDFGVVKPVAIFISRRGSAANAPDVDAYQIGGSAPIGQGILSGTYSKLKNKLNDTYSASGWGLRYEYLLSKRTRLYAGITGITNRANAAFTISGGGSSSAGLALSGPGADPRSGFMGISHTF